MLPLADHFPFHCAQRLGKKEDVPGWSKPDLPVVRSVKVVSAPASSTSRVSVAAPLVAPVAPATLAELSKMMVNLTKQMALLTQGSGSPAVQVRALEAPPKKKGKGQQPPGQPANAFSSLSVEDEDAC